MATEEMKISPAPDRLVLEELTVASSIVVPTLFKDKLAVGRLIAAGEDVPNLLVEKLEAGMIILYSPFSGVRFDVKQSDGSRKPVVAIRWHDALVIIGPEALKGIKGIRELNIDAQL